MNEEVKIFAEPVSLKPFELPAEELEKRLIIPPKTYGVWVFPNASTQNKFVIAAYSKPNWFHKKMMKLILNFDWIEHS